VRGLLLFLALYVLEADLADAADGTWMEIPPPTRRDHTAILDPVRDRMVVFGGSEGDVLRSEGLAFALATQTWTVLPIAGPGPSARVGHSAVYDPVRDRMLVFGGWDGTTGVYRNDVWALSLSGILQWTLIAAAGTPPSTRYQHTAVYDPVVDRMLVFGGRDTGGRRNDTWELSLVGTPTWTLINPTSPLPPPRTSHSAIIDPIRRRMLVFAGLGSSSLDDLWALSLDGVPSWTPITPPGARPLRTFEHIAVYDAAHDRMIVDGGSDGLYGTRDCWALPLAPGASWQQFPLHDRWQHAAIYDPLRDVVVVHGGTILFGHDNATWKLVLAPPAQWQRVSTSGADGVPRQLSATTIYDPIGHRMVLFGGLASGCFDPCPGGPTVSYSLSDHQWTWLDQGPVRYDHSAIYDPVRQRMVVFGGDEFYGSMLNDTWSLSLAGAQQWNPVVPSGSPPLARRAHTAVYDPIVDRMLVFGGTSGRWPGDGTLFNDVWELSFVSNEWTLLSPLGVPPSPRENHTAIYDPAGEHMIVFGGQNFSGGMNDLWSLSLSSPPTWAPIAADGPPPSPRATHTALYDPIRARMIVHGGTPAGDVWTLDLSSPGTATWEPFDAEGVPPSGREEHTAIYDAAADRLVACGGWSQGLFLWLGSSAVTVLTFGEVNAVPATGVSTPGLALLRARPNPASGAFEVLFESYDHRPAMLDLIDVAGRRIARQDLGLLAPGSHWVEFSDPRAPAGTYFLRLTQDGRSTSAKISIVH
jgi:hypothetical protein